MAKVGRVPSVGGGAMAGHERGREVSGCWLAGSYLAAAAANAAVHRACWLCLSHENVHAITHGLSLFFRMVCLLAIFIISYFIPEDGDIETQPNVFLAPKPRQQGYPVTLGQVKQAFPLPGRYHFRFKSPVVPGTDRERGALAVWMDCTDDRQPVLTWKSQIVAKVTRIGIEEDDDDDDDEDFRRPSPQAQQQQQSAPPPQQRQPPPQQPHNTPPPPAPPAKQPSFDLFDAAAPAPAAPAAGGGTGDLLGGGGHHPPAAAPNSGSLLDMNFPQQQQQQSSSAHHADFLGMTSGPSPPVSGNHNNSNSNNNPYGQPPQPRQQMNHNHRSGSFDSFNSGNNNNNNSNNNQGGGGAFGGLGTPWMS